MAKVGYSRVSTGKQEQRMQIQALKDEGCDYVVSEVGSGADQNARPQLASLIASLAEGDTLVVWRMDRLARSVKELTGIATNLQDRGISLRSLTEHIDTTTPHGRMIFHFFALLAQFERDLIVERTRAGLEAARAKGRRGGRKRLLSESQLKQARRWLDAGQMTQQQAARALGVSRATLARRLRKQVEVAT